MRCVVLRILPSLGGLSKIMLNLYQLVSALNILYLFLSACFFPVCLNVDVLVRNYAAIPYLITKGSISEGVYNERLFLTVRRVARESSLSCPCEGELGRSAAVQSDERRL